LVRVTGAGTIDLGTKMMGFRVEPKLVMTTEGQGRTADPVGLGIPVMIEGPWSEPRIYPDMAGMLDNPDAAYAKLREMGKGLFGGNGGGLGGLLNGLGGLGGNPPAGGGGASGGSTPQDPLGGRLGETLGNLIQQGLGGSSGRSLPKNPLPDASAPAPAPPSSATASQPSDPPPPPPPQQQDSQPMNDVLRQLFNR
jgi:AsmA protein